MAVDWDYVVEGNRDALKRFLAMMLAQGAAPPFSPCGRRCPEGADEGCWTERGGEKQSAVNTLPPRRIPRNTPHPARPSADPPSPAGGEGGSASLARG